MNRQGYIMARRDLNILKTRNVELLSAVEIQCGRVRSFLELARQHSHADQVASVNALEALRNHGFYAQQTGPFSSPAARGARSVFLPCKHYHRHSLFLIL